MSTFRDLGIGERPLGSNRSRRIDGYLRRAKVPEGVIKAGKENGLASAILGDEFFRAQMGERELAGLMNIGAYLGDAPSRARDFAGAIEGQTAVLD